MMPASLLEKILLFAVAVVMPAKAKSSYPHGCKLSIAETGASLRKP